MPFTGYPFLLFFLPVAIAGFALARRFTQQSYGIWWLLAASTVFCGWMSPKNLLALSLSIAVNFLLGRYAERKAVLVTGLLFNCGLLLFFKYTGFFITVWNQTTGRTVPVQAIALPLGISFYTFVQISYLLEIYRKESKPASLRDFLLMVTFFPKFLAGPIVRPGDFLSQPGTRRGLTSDAVASGLALFAMGFAKKLLADSCTVWVRPVFAAAESPSGAFGVADAWLGVLAYTFQIYFDFSGYSDMAIGLGTLFGWRIPVNFNSPYKARSVIDFWRRWHMTLTSFLTENIFFRLPGSRKGMLRRHLNLMITMVICGFWHGAGWTFLVWGALHGAYLIVNHTWRKARESGAWGRWRMPIAGQALTIVCVAAGWALFGAGTIAGGARLIQRMFGFGGPVTAQLFDPSDAAWATLWIVFLGILAMTGRNTQEILIRYKPSIILAVVRIRSWSLSWLIPGLATLWVIGFMLYLIDRSVGSPFMYAIF